MKRLFYLLLLGSLFFVNEVRADNAIKLNEVIVDLSPQSVELINTSSEVVNISNWYLDDSGGNSYFTIPSNTVIYPNSCIVFASEFNLNKSSSDTVRLFDVTAPPTSSSAQLIDSYSYATGPGSSLSFSRIPDGDVWSTAAPTIGKYNSTGITCILLPTSTPTPVVTSSPATTISPTPTATHIENIFISEVMVNPETGQSEWVELFNDNAFEVSLTNWFIDDEKDAGATPKQFSASIPAKGYAFIELTSGIFNNDEDWVRLLNQNSQDVNSLQYSVSEKGKTIARTDWISGTVCNQESTKGMENSQCIIESLSPSQVQASNSSSIIKTPTPTKIPKTILSTLRTETEEQEPSPTPVYKTIQPYKASATSGIVTQDLDRSDATVLGTTTVKNPQNIFYLLKSLTLSSGSFSLFTLISLVVKLKLKDHSPPIE